MFESLYIFAAKFDREAPAPVSEVSGWLGVQGFLAGLVFNIFGLAAVALLSSDEKRAGRIGWAIGGTLAAFGLALLAI